MSKLSAFRGIPLPKNWPESIKLAVIHSIALAHQAITYSRSFAINSCASHLIDRVEFLRLRSIHIDDEVRRHEAARSASPLEKPDSKLDDSWVFLCRGPDEFGRRGSSRNIHEVFFVDDFLQGR